MLTLGLIGRGAWARIIGATLDSLPELRWVPLSGPGVSVDGVIIANRSKDHVSSALPFVEAGVACFVEKPVATSLEDFLRLKAAADASGSHVFAGHLHRFNPAAEAFCAALPEIGELQSATAFCANGKPRDDTSVIWDWLPHPLSLAARIFGTPADRATARSLEGGARPLRVAAQLSYEGRVFDLEASWLSPEPAFRITATGTGGRLILDDKAAQKVTLMRDGESVALAYDPELPLTRELRAFVDLIRGVRDNPSPLDAAEDVLRSLDAIERSAAAEGAPVAINWPV